jgi:hypothetical protein
MKRMKLFDFVRNRLLTPEMIKLEVERQIKTGGRFYLLTTPSFNLLLFCYSKRKALVKVIIIIYN